jgi:transposase
VGPVRRAAATTPGLRPLSSARLSPAADPGPDHLRKLVQVLRFGCSYDSIADCGCSATTIRERRNEWIRAGILAKLKAIARESYDRIVGLVLEEIIVDTCITKAPGEASAPGAARWTAASRA